MPIHFIYTYAPISTSFQAALLHLNRLPTCSQGRHAHNVHHTTFHPIPRSFLAPKSTTYFLPRSIHTHTPPTAHLATSFQAAPSHLDRPLTCFRGRHSHNLHRTSFHLCKQLPRTNFDHLLRPKVGTHTQNHSRDTGYFRSCTDLVLPLQRWGHSFSDPERA